VTESPKGENKIGFLVSAGAERTIEESKMVSSARVLVNLATAADSSVH